MSKSFFMVERDIYVGSIYIPHEGSPYGYDGMYEEIQQDILDPEVLLVGDFNARTNTCADFISSGGNNGEFRTSRHSSGEQCCFSSNRWVVYRKFVE